MKHLAYIVRPQYLLWDIAHGNLATPQRFTNALRQWLADREGREPPLCLACDRTDPFEREEPAAFFLVEFDFEGAPRKGILSGVCENCARRSDTELLRVGIFGVFGDDGEEVLRTAEIDLWHGGPPMARRAPQHGPVSANKTKPDTTTFAVWLTKTPITPDFVGDFIKQARADPDFPQVVPSIKALRQYLADKRADRDIRLAAEDAWLDYRAWCKRQRRAERRNSHQRT